MNKKLLSIVITSSLLVACGGSSSSSGNGDLQTASSSSGASSSGSAPSSSTGSSSSSSSGNSTSSSSSSGSSQDGDSQSYDYVLQVAENTVAEPLGLALQTHHDNAETVLRLQSNGFPNQINKMTDGKGDITQGHDKIKDLFDLFINAQTGQVELLLKQTLDFEAINAPFSLEVQLGDETKKVLVNVFDVQKGTAAEPLVISSYNELTSFASGRFVSENIGFDIISGLPDSQQNLRNKNESANSSVQGREGLHVRLDRDIDASASQSDPWQAIEHIGSINGSGHVIDQLNMTGFINNPDRFHSSSVSNLGFTNATTSRTVLSLPSGGISKVFFEGQYIASATGVNFAPFSISGTATSIYANAYYELQGVTGDVRISGLINSSSSSVRMDSAYANGAVSPQTFQGKQGINVAGISHSGITLDLLSSNYVNTTTFYSAFKMDFKMVNRDYTYAGLDVTDHRYAGLASGTTDYPDNIKSDSLAANSSDYQWKFVNNRNQSPMTIRHGNLRRDKDINENLPQNGPDVSAAAITEAQLMQASNFTGRWLNSQFDIEDGEYPVLKGMPYPHIEGASWMSAEDPGVAYQRATYNKYLTKPE